ncbi:ArsR/SmtB family transcription factor [Sphingosinicella rhizophila]|uniref:Metalloregulator ArsR/SmtB family transcription factor n=1 Tax=Sphingosinicella rhizophila TaxID=3050082 RepID=A0ABU3QCP0_9SPHN|nr:metalloregulator ArsR/SmtB family transcription factor [Sphingosinicella sp. GR2756]MDT9600748.1 metalloregulator ArsR/SmtB family transcription factor [Sphingosinicella sp. GR2756]
MDTNIALDCFAALSQATRLETFRLLVRHEPEGLAAGDIARMLQVPANTMSTHLAILARTGLIGSKRESRSIVYRVDLDRIRALMLFLIKDCCEGRSELCQPLADELLACRA